MVSTFHGLETAKRGMTAQQSALYTVGHNISNANTDGYTRQRVDFSTTEPYPGTGLNRPQIAGQLGTGVESGAVQRVRESFLDLQYRTENTKLGYYSSLSSALSKMEDIMNEPSDSGLQSVMSNFWNSLQDLANNPENLGTRQVVASNGEMVADTFNYYYNSLDSIKSDLGSEIDVTVKKINSIISQIDELNKQIASVEPHGLLPNDLYDQRDQLVDELSGLVNIKVSTVKPDNYGQPAATAAGLYQIELIQKDGKSFGTGAMLLSVEQTTGATTVNTLTVTVDNTVGTPLNGNVKEIKVGDVVVKDATSTSINFNGELAGLIESYGYEAQETDGNTVVKGHYPEMLEKLNKLAFAFASEFNNIHSQGYGMNQSEKAGNFFDLGDDATAYKYDPKIAYAKQIQVKDEIVSDPTKVAASSIGGDNNSGNNEIARKLADVKAKDFSQYFKDEKGNQISGAKLPDDMNSGTFDFYYSAMIGDLGVSAQSANRNMDNVQVLVDSVENNRQSVSGVSLDEEMTNMITFQHAYNASARMITIIDEMLDKIINGMGVSGR